MTPSKLLCTTAALVLASSLAWAGDPRLETRSEADKKTVAVLESLKVSLNFTETSLDEVVDFLREITSLNILVSKGVKESGEEHPITLKVEELRAMDAISLLVEMVDLSFKMEDGVIMIVTKDETKADAFLELYDVRDLLFRLRDFKAPEISLTTAGTGEEGPIGIDTSGGEEEGGSLEDPTFLVDIIKTHTCGTSWNDNPKCSCEIQNGILIVTQTKEGHVQVSTLIEKLRQYK
jgi:type II secretory pathway component GspD/PulD (secretin)